MVSNSKKFAQRLYPSIAKSKLWAAEIANLLLPKRSNLVLFATSLALVSGAGCTSFYKKEKTVSGDVGSAQGTWRGRAYVKDSKTGKSGAVELEILAVEPSRLRIEAVGAFGVHLASIALKDGEARIALTREKKFFSGPANRESLSRIVPVRLSPQALLALLFERPLSVKEGWLCVREPRWVCTNEAAGVSLEKAEASAPTRRYKITAPDATVDLLLDEAKAKVEMNDEAFKLEKPAGYELANPI